MVAYHYIVRLKHTLQVQSKNRKIVMPTYDEWNKAIISYVFENREPGEKVFLHTTAEALPDIAEHAGFNVQNAEESLKEAVRKKVVLKNVTSTDEIWLRRISPAEKEPPHVAFLALCVLAASNMETTEEAYQTNYYLQLNKLLFGKSIGGKPKGLKYKEWEESWKHLQRWVKEEYDIELYLTQGHPKYVWYPISQCLISNHERRNIYTFFHSHNLTPFSNIQEEKLEKDLGTWLRSSSGSAKIERFFSKEVYKQSIVNQVNMLLEHWDGIPIPPGPIIMPIISKISVQFLPENSINEKIRYWFPRRGRDEIDCEDNSLEIGRLKTYTSKMWFRPVIDSKSTFWKLTDHLRLQTNETKPMVYTLHQSAVWVFRRDSECDNGWISKRNMQLHQNHIIVFQERYIERIKVYLSQSCEHDIDSLDPTYVNNEEYGWLHLRVKPTKLKSFDDPNLWMLSVKSSEQISFSGGLSVKDEDGHQAYLNICLPSISVPELGLSNDERLRICGQSLPVNKERLINLEDSMDVGIHLISYGGKTRELRIITPERSLEHQEKTLAAKLSTDKKTIPTYYEKDIVDISEGLGVWLSGAMFLGKEIPKTTWGNLAKPTIPKDKEKQLLEIPAEIISSVVKEAIKLQKKRSPIPKWFKKTFKDLDQNVALRTLIQKKLQEYKEIALSYDDLHKLGGE